MLEETLGKLKPHQEPKMWEDLTTEKKIERIREEVKKQLSYQSQRLNEISRQLEELRNHNHIGDKIVVPINRRFSGMGECLAAKRADGKSYF